MREHLLKGFCILSLFSIIVGIYGCGRIPGTTRPIVIDNRVDVPEYSARKQKPKEISECEVKKYCGKDCFYIGSIDVYKSKGGALKEAAKRGADFVQIEWGSTQMDRYRTVGIPDYHWTELYSDTVDYYTVSMYRSNDPELARIRVEQEQRKRTVDERLAECGKLIDVFHDNRNNWPIGNNSQMSASINSGSYVLEHKRNYGSMLWWKKINAPIGEERILTSSITMIEGQKDYGYGIVWSLMDVDNYYEFIITSNGYYRYAKIVNGKTIVIQPWKSSSDINKGNSPNTLSVTKTILGLEFRINYKTAFKSDYEEWYFGGVGFIIYRNAKIKVDAIDVLDVPNWGSFIQW